MSVIPTVSADGVGVVSAGQLNAYTFSCYNAGVLRSIVGQTGMTAYLQGTNVPADGGQSAFYWNYTSTAPDNNSTVIVPYGVVQGAWVLLPVISSSGTTGTGLTVLNTSPTLVTPVLKSPTFSSGATGSGNVVLATSATLVTPTLTNATISTPTVSSPTVTGTATMASINASGTISVNSHQAVNGPAVSVYLSTNQSITTATYTKVTLNTEEFDTNSNFDSITNNRFTPTVSGYYQINGAISASATSGTAAAIALYKNGSLYKLGTQVVLTTGNFSSVGLTVQAVTYFNGATDYMELWGNITGTSPSFTGGSTACTFSASMVRGQ